MMSDTLEQTTKYPDLKDQKTYIWFIYRRVITRDVFDKIHEIFASAGGMSDNVPMTLLAPEWFDELWRKIPYNAGYGFTVRIDNDKIDQTMRALEALGCICGKDDPDWSVTKKLIGGMKRLKSTRLHLNKMLVQQ
jgi:hypothetical protein